VPFVVTLPLSSRRDLEKVKDKENAPASPAPRRGSIQPRLGAVEGAKKGKLYIRLSQMKHKIKGDKGQCSTLPRAFLFDVAALLSPASD